MLACIQYIPPIHTTIHATIHANTSFTYWHVLRCNTCQFLHIAITDGNCILHSISKTIIKAGLITDGVDWLSWQQDCLCCGTAAMETKQLRDCKDNAVEAKILLQQLSWKRWFTYIWELTELKAEDLQFCPCWSEEKRKAFNSRLSAYTSKSGCYLKSLRWPLKYPNHKV